MAKMTEEQIYDTAKERVMQKRDFYSHLMVYIVVNAALIGIWYFTRSTYPWFIWPLAGWGIGLIFHGLDVFMFHRGSAWEQREIQKEADRLRKTDGNG